MKKILLITLAVINISSLFPMETAEIGIQTDLAEEDWIYQDNIKDKYETRSVVGTGLIFGVLDKKKIDRSSQRETMLDLDIHYNGGKLELSDNYDTDSRKYENVEQDLKRKWPKFPVNSMWSGILCQKGKRPYVFNRYHLVKRTHLSEMLEFMKKKVDETEFKDNQYTLCMQASLQKQEAVINVITPVETKKEQCDASNLRKNLKRLVGNISPNSFWNIIICRMDKDACIVSKDFELKPDKVLDVAMAKINDIIPVINRKKMERILQEQKKLSGKSKSTTEVTASQDGIEVKNTHNDGRPEKSVKIRISTPFRLKTAIYGFLGLGGLYGLYKLGQSYMPDFSKLGALKIWRMKRP